MSFSLFSNENMYVDSHKVVVWGNSIYVHKKDDFWIKTDAIYCDDKGVFIKYEDQLRYEVQLRCPRCGTYYDSFPGCPNPNCR